MPPTKVGLNPTYLREQTWFEDFQGAHHGGHSGYQNGTILTVLNLYVALIPSIKLQLNPTYSLGAFVWRFSRWLTWRPSWILERNDLRKSKSPFGPMPSTKFRLNLTQDLRADVDSQTEQLKQSWISMSLQCFPSSFRSIQLTTW